MLKILLTLLVMLDLVVLFLLVCGTIAAIKAGGGSILFPGLGLVVALPLVLVVLLVMEVILVAASIVLYRYIQSDKLT